MILVPYHLHQAAVLLDEISTWSAETHADLDEPIKEAMFSTSRAIAFTTKLLIQLTAKHNAARAIEFLRELKVDYTLLLYLQLPEPIRKKSGFICYLESVCNQLKVDFSTRHFYDSVWTYFERQGVSLIAHDKYITSYKKAVIIEEYNKVKKSWGVHNAFFFQTYTTNEKDEFVENVYHITKTAQDGVTRLLDILKAGEFPSGRRVYKATGAFEHIIDPINTLTCQLYDCEIMSSVFDGKMSVQEIENMVEGFTRSISSLMIKEELIDIATIVTFVVKKRTRKVGLVGEDNTKVSYHFTPNICAPKSIHRQAMSLFLASSKGKITEACASIKDTKRLPEKYHDDPLITLDLGAIKSNGITTAFSRKKESDPFPRLAYTEEVCAGCTETLHECLKDPQDLKSDNLDDGQRRMLLYTQLYTTPKKEMICYDSLETLSDMADGTGEVIFFNF